MNIARNRCLYLSLFVYHLCRAVDRKGDYKINIVMKFFKEKQYGHAWVTRNDKDFLGLGGKFYFSTHILLGQNSKYRYYIHKRNFEKWATNQLAVYG